MAIDTEIDLEALHQSVRDAIAAEFPSFAEVGDYQVSRKKIMTPAVLVELMDMEAAPEDDPGTEQLAMLTKWVARVVIDFATASPALEARKRAAALGHFAHQQRWGHPVSPARVTVIGPDAFDPDLDRLEVWAVEWEQIVHIGPSVFDDEGVVPSEVMIGYAPEIGIPHEEDYEPFDGELVIE